jgi:hypothetical protein
MLPILLHQVPVLASSKPHRSDLVVYTSLAWKAINASALSFRKGGRKARTSLSNLRVHGGDTSTVRSI